MSRHSKRRRSLWVAIAIPLALTSTSSLAAVFESSGLVNVARWDAAPRMLGLSERSLVGGLRYSMEGGSYEAYRDLFEWEGDTPSVEDLTQAVRSAFKVWTVDDSEIGLSTDLYFVEDLNTPVIGNTPGTVRANPLSAEIDLFASNDGLFWNPSDTFKAGDVFFASIASTEVTLTSGTENYPSSAIIGVDVRFNNNPGTEWTLLVFRALLTNTAGHAIGLDNVDNADGADRFVDDNFDGSTSETALATLSNSWAHLVDPLEPARSALQIYEVPDADPGFDTPGVNILMEVDRVFEATSEDDIPGLSN